MYAISLDLQGHKTMGVIITIILIIIVIKFALSQPYSFEGSLSYWFILIVGIALALFIGGLFL